MRAAMGTGLPPVLSAAQCAELDRGPSPLPGQCIYLQIFNILWTRSDVATASGQLVVDAGGVEYTFELRRAAKGWSLSEMSAREFIE